MGPVALHSCRFSKRDPWIQNQSINASIAPLDVRYLFYYLYSAIGTDQVKQDCTVVTVTSRRSWVPSRVWKGNHWHKLKTRLPVAGRDEIAFRAIRPIRSYSYKLSQRGHYNRPSPLDT
jgi:hypothetical protein